MRCECICTDFRVTPL